MYGVVVSSLTDCTICYCVTGAHYLTLGLTGTIVQAYIEILYVHGVSSVYERHFVNFNNTTYTYHNITQLQHHAHI